MTAIPATFRAYVAEKVDRDGTAAVDRGVRDVRGSDLPPGEVEVRVEWSSVNYKDGLATRVDGKVARISPLIPGIDLAGEVIAERGPLDRRGVEGARARLRHRRVAPRRVHAVPAGAGRLGRAAGRRPVVARRDEHRDRGVHRGDVRGGPRGARPDASGRAGPRDRRQRRRGRHRAGDPGRAWLRGLGGHRQARRGGAAHGRWRGRDPDTGRGDRRGQAARIGALGRGRRRGRRRDAAIRAANPAHRRGRGGQRQRRRARRSRRRSSRSSSAAWPCSGWTR